MHIALCTFQSKKQNNFSPLSILVPKQLLRHLEKYETILPVAKAETISAVAVERNEMTFSSKDEIVLVIERNQALIFDKAQYVKFYTPLHKLKHYSNLLLQ